MMKFSILFLKPKLGIRLMGEPRWFIKRCSSSRKADSPASTFFFSSALGFGVGRRLSSSCCWSSPSVRLLLASTELLLELLLLLLPSVSLPLLLLLFCWFPLELLWSADDFLRSAVVEAETEAEEEVAVFFFELSFGLPMLLLDGGELFLPFEFLLLPAVRFRAAAAAAEELPLPLPFFPLVVAPFFG